MNGEKKFTDRMDEIAGDMLLHSTDDDDGIFFEEDPEDGEIFDVSEILASEWFFSSEPLPE